MAVQSINGFAYWQFVLLGVATLMAWNIYIVSSDFFRYEFSNTPFKENFESIFSILSNIINLIALTYALYTQPKADHDKRIRVGLISTVFVFVSIFFLPVLQIKGWASLIIATLSLGVAAVAAAFIQCSIYGIVATLPPYCSEGYMSGQAIAGTIASAAQLLTVYFGNGKSSLAVLSGNVGGSGSGGDDAVWWLRVRTSIYFGLSALFMVVSTTVWSQLKKTLGSEQGISQTQGSAEVYQAVASNEDEGAIGDGEEVETGSRAVPGLLAPMRDTSPRLDRLDGAVYDNGNAHGQGTMLDSQVSHRDSDATFFEDEQMTEQPSLPQWITALGLENTQMLYTTFVEIRPFVYICAIVMGVTLAVFPPLTEAIISSPKSVPRINNLTAWHFLLFNIGDYLGRLSTQWIKCSTAKILHWTNSGRILLIPILLMFPTLATPVSRLVIINSDLLFLFVVLLLGWSNGWIATMALILGPRFASNKELAGSVLGFALCIGLAFGAIASYPVLLVAGIS